MHLSAIDIGGIIVALVAAIGAWLSQRAASKATFTNNTVTSRLDAEKEAYERAREFDTETIRRQTDEIARLRMENSDLKAKLNQMNERLERLESTSVIQLQHLLERAMEDKKDAPDQE